MKGLMPKDQSSSFKTVGSGAGCSKKGCIFCDIMANISGPDAHFSRPMFCGPKLVVLRTINPKNIKKEASHMFNRIIRGSPLLAGSVSGCIWGFMILPFFCCGPFGPPPDLGF